jgi:hypothetical protein
MAVERRPHDGTQFPEHPDVPALCHEIIGGSNRELPSSADQAIAMLPRVSIERRADAVTARRRTR